MSKSRKDLPRLVNEVDSSSNQIPETQNNDNSFENVNEKSVHNDQSAKDVKKDTLNSVKNTLSMPTSMPSSELMKGGGRVQPGLPSMSASILNSDIKLVSDSNNDITPSTSSKFDLTYETSSDLEPSTTTASSHSSSEIASKSLEKAFSTPSTGAVPKMRSSETPSLDEVTPSLGERGLVDNCLSTMLADSTKATNEDVTREDDDANPDLVQQSRILKSLKSLASNVDEDESIFPIITANSGNVVLHLLVDNCNQTTLFTNRSVQRNGALVCKGKKSQCMV